jgi:hypothetical protein
MFIAKHSLIQRRRLMRQILIIDVRMEKLHLITDLFIILRIIEKTITSLFNSMIEISSSLMISLEKLYLI